MSLLGRIKRRMLRQPENKAIVMPGVINPDIELPWLQEQIRAYASIQKVRATLFTDNFTGETIAMRDAYRAAMAEPAVKGALLGKIAAVQALGIQVNPYDDTPLDHEVADFVQHAFDRTSGGVPALVWSILSGGLIDGFSVSEPVWKEEQHGRFKGKKTLHKLKSKDTRFIQFEIDRFRNITSVISMRGNSGEAFNPSNFVIFSHLSLFENPMGMSDLRASYRAVTMIASLLKLRMIFLDKYAGPYLIGKTGDKALQSSLMDRLAEARAAGYIVVPEGTEIELMNLAQSGTADFQAALEDLRQEVAIGISGAFLHMMTGMNPGARGDSNVQQDTVDLFIWLLAVSVSAVLQEQLVPDLVGVNYGTQVGHPLVTMEAPNPEAILKALQIFESVQALGVEISKSEVRKVANTRPPRDQADTAAQPGMGAAGLPADDPPANPFAGGDVALFAENEAGFSGVVTDALGRKRKYQNGKQVPLNDGKDKGGAYKEHADKGGKHAEHIAASDHIVSQLAADAANKPGVVQKVRDAVAKVYPVVFNVATKLALVAHDVREDILDTADDYSKITYAKAGARGNVEHDPIAQHLGIPSSAAFSILSKVMAYAVTKLAGTSKHAELDPVELLLELITAHRDALGQHDQPLPSRDEVATLLAARQAKRKGA